MLTGEVSYSASSECPRAYLMMKIDAILGYLTIRAERKTLRRSHLPALEFSTGTSCPRRNGTADHCPLVQAVHCSEHVRQLMLSRHLGGLSQITRESRRVSI